MARDLFERHAVVRLLVYATAIIAVLYAIGMMWGVVAHYANVILMLFLAWIIVFALQPLLSRIERLGAPRLLAVTLVYLALFGVVAGSILLALPTIRTQATHLTAILSGLLSAENVQALNQRIVGLLQGFGVSPGDARAFVAQAEQQIQSSTGKLSGQVVAMAESWFGQAVSVFFNATVIIILSFYMMLDGEAMLERIIKRLPPAWIPDVRLFQSHVNAIFGGFLRAALVIALVYAALNWIALAALGQPSAILFALLAGMLLVVPWIGVVLAMVPPALLVILDSPPEVMLRNLVILIIVLFVAQQVTMQVVAPRIISAHTGMHPLLFFAALLIGTREAGVWGMLFGPPVAAVLVAMLDTFFERWQRTSGKYPDLMPGGPSEQEKPVVIELGTAPPATAATAASVPTAATAATSIGETPARAGPASQSAEGKELVESTS